MYALANRLTVNDFTNSVTTTRILAGIDTFTILTDRVHRAVFVRGASTLELTAFAPGVRIANVVGRALANGTSRCSGHTNGGRMARIGLAGVEGTALDVCHGIGLETRWTLANGFMVVGYADGIDATRVLVAGVVARVSL